MVLCVLCVVCVVCCLFKVGLVELLKYFGIMPHVVLGHSAGEVAAAYASGLLSLSDSVKVVYHRSFEQQRLEGSGRMLAVAMGKQEVMKYIDDMVSVMMVISMPVLAPCLVPRIITSLVH